MVKMELIQNRPMWRKKEHVGASVLCNCTLYQRLLLMFLILMAYNFDFSYSLFRECGSICYERNTHDGCGTSATFFIIIVQLE